MAETPSERPEITREQLDAFETVIGAAVLWRHHQRAKGHDTQHIANAIDRVADVYHALAYPAHPE